MLFTALQGLLGAKEGAVFRWVRRADPASEQWRIFMLEGGKFLPVGAMARRPTADDLSNAFYNAAAAQSPVTKGIQWLKQLATKK